MLYRRRRRCCHSSFVVEGKLSRYWIALSSIYKHACYDRSQGEEKGPGLAFYTAVVMDGCMQLGV